MNLPNKIKSTFSRLSLIPILLITFILSSLTIYAQSPQLSLVDIFTALRSNKATLPQKNNILSEGVKQRGITFEINEILEKELRNAGADDNLILAIVEKSPVKEVSEKDKVVKPQPVATPKPPDFAYYRNRANSHFVMSKFEKAIKDYDEAIKLNAQDPNVFFSRGMAYYNIKQFNLAIADFGKVIELDSEESMAYYNRANALKEVGGFEKALEDYKKASELDSENEAARKAFEKLQADLNPQPDKKPTRAKTPNTNKFTDEIKTPETTESKQPDEQAELISNELPNIGALQNLAIKLAVPKYPMFERQRNIGGLINVEVILDKDGKVISAKAINGSRALRRASENAVRRSRFNPFKVDGVAKSAKGIISYNFKTN